MRRDQIAEADIEALDDSQQSEEGQLIGRALDLRAALDMGITITLDEIAADEFHALQVIEQERNRFESEKLERGSGQ